MPAWMGPLALIVGIVFLLLWAVGGWYATAYAVGAGYDWHGLPTLFLVGLILLLLYFPLNWWRTMEDRSQAGRRRRLRRRGGGRLACRSTAAGSTQPTDRARCCSPRTADRTSRRGRSRKRPPSPDPGPSRSSRSRRSTAPSSACRTRGSCRTSRSSTSASGGSSGDPRAPAARHRMRTGRSRRRAGAKKLAADRARPGRAGRS